MRCIVHRLEEMILIEVKNLVKRYGKRNVVDNLSFSVEKGKIVGFLGPNGAGKSTTMNMLTGYIAATEGNIKINGYDIWEEPEKIKKMIGYLPEMPPIYPDMLVKEYLKFVCELKKVKSTEQERMIDKVMRRTKIKDVSGRLIKNLSKGYKQRVGLAGAMIGDPQILILDEPTVGLDPKQILEIRELILELSNNHTILLSSHIMQEISAVCSDVIIINEGKLVIADSLENITTNAKKASVLVVEAKAELDVVNEIMQGLAIENEYKTEAKEDVVEIRISNAVEQDIREDLFFAFAKANIALVKMEMEELSLEDAYIQLIAQKGGKLNARDL